MCVRAVDAVTQTAPEAFVIVEHDVERVGFAETCNAGAARTTAGTLIFINDDTIVLPGWLEGLTDALYGPQGADIAGCRLVYPDGRIQHTGAFLRRDQLGRLEAFNRRTDAQTGYVPAVTGACLAIKRGTWDRLEGFDEAFINGYEDIDLAIRVREAGGEVIYTADATVVHFESQSPGRFDRAPDNIALLQLRWGHLLEKGVAA
jgi:GT2 family glycosyltransferase